MAGMTNISPPRNSRAEMTDAPSIPPSSQLQNLLQEPDPIGLWYTGAEMVELDADFMR